jgi:thiol-disulfide isomerase/thioredoxin
MKIYGQIYSFNEFVIEIEKIVDADFETQHPLVKASSLNEFTKLNLARMKRIYKTMKVESGLQVLLEKISTPQTWYVITEAWCGDSAQSLPAIARLAERNNNVDLSIIMRDYNPDIMQKYLSNGSASIPKLFALDKRGNELFSWGPRPTEAQEILLNWKANPDGRTWVQFETELHSWYAKDKTHSLQNEFYEIFKKHLYY